MHKSSRKHDSGKGAPGAEFGIAKQDLRPKVQRHLDNLQAQVTRILAKYDVSSFEELKALGEEDSDEVEMDDITRLLELSHAIARVVEYGEIFINTTEVEVSLDGYDNAHSPQDIAGKIVFVAERDDKWFIATEDGKELGKQYDDVEPPQEIAGKIVFVAVKDGKWFIATEDGKELGKQYDDVDFPQEIAGKIVFRAVKDGKWFIATEDGTEIGKDNLYEQIYELSQVDSTHVAVIAKQGNKYVRHILEIPQAVAGSE